LQGKSRSVAHKVMRPRKTGGWGRERKAAGGKNASRLGGGVRKLPFSFCEKKKLRTEGEA